MRGRLFSYGDAQRYRLGVNHGQIPVNAPRFPFHSYHRDGAMQVNTNHGSTIVYKSNNCGWLQEQPDFSEPPLSLEGAGDHWNHREDYDYYSHSRVLFHLKTLAQRQVPFENTARSLGDAPREVQLHHIGNCTKADPAVWC